MRTSLSAIPASARAWRGRASPEVDPTEDRASERPRSWSIEVMSEPAGTQIPAV
jgi:hypothetical protein